MRGSLRRVNIKSSSCTDFYLLKQKVFFKCFQVFWAANGGAY
jgi:hypothetical protein